MTVSEAKSWNGVMTAWCDWFEGKTKQHGSFPVTSLEVDEEPESGSSDYRPRGTPGRDSWME
jgi:uncharacterized protein YodC (DUF2158 family)